MEMTDVGYKINFALDKEKLSNPGSPRKLAENLPSILILHSRWEMVEKCSPDWLFVFQECLCH